ncbi:hypothetical protein [Stenotrophomonas sp. TWI1183]|uniref:hypothetical protein n=1 Tax=Stenotrophomonas sp. TWI1183 TaxID=3136799 RepID=UPI003208F860
MADSGPEFLSEPFSQSAKPNGVTCDASNPASPTRTPFEKMSDVLKEGDRVKVKVLEVAKPGRIARRSRTCRMAKG